ncbi:DUF2313 domain-containing protein [Salmonella enterica subsp. enterica serovar Kotte]|nr:DUF2313 domain-containing protein [Salmonella enterica subsp. enterica serovar Kotte]
MGTVDRSNRPPRNGDLYAGALLNLLPSGLAWNKRPGNAYSNLMQALAGAFARADADKCQLISNERTPEAAEWMLTDWEEFLGLPECGELSQSVPERQSVAANKLRFYGSLNVAFYEQLAAAYGYTVVITEPKPYVMRVHVYGDVPSREATVIDHCETPLTIYGATDLYCALERYKPAHEGVLYVYEEE